VKQEPVLLGSKAQKEAFPEAVYPGEIPGAIPISFRYEGVFAWNASQPQGVNQTASYIPRTDIFQPNNFTIISAGSFGTNLSFWIDDDISTGGSGANGGLGDGYLKYNDLGRFLHLPKDSLNVRFGQFELDLPFTQARTIYLSDYDVFDQANVAGAAGTTTNPFILGAPQRAIEFGGYPNDGNFMWSVAVTNGNNDSPAARNTKDVYLRSSYQFNLERDPQSRHAIQAAGPTGPHDHTSLRVGGFYYHGDNVQNIGATAPLSGPWQLLRVVLPRGGRPAVQVPHFSSTGAVQVVPSSEEAERRSFWLSDQTAYTYPKLFTASAGKILAVPFVAPSEPAGDSSVRSVLSPPAPVITIDHSTKPRLRSIPWR
jgi:hypothetical protein